jgi:hypothetical protein
VRRQGFRSRVPPMGGSPDTEEPFAQRLWASDNQRAKAEGWDHGVAHHQPSTTIARVPKVPRDVHAARRSPSIWSSQVTIWFQLEGIWDANPTGTPRDERVP